LSSPGDNYLLIPNPDKSGQRAPQRHPAWRGGRAPAWRRKIYRWKIAGCDV